MTIGLRPPDKFQPPTSALFVSIVTVVTAVLALYLTVRLIFDIDGLPPEHIGDLVALTGILWAVPTIIVAGYYTGLRPPPPPPPPVLNK